MKSSDIPPEQVKKAMRHLVDAAIALREEGEDRFWDEEYTAALIETLSSGRRWRSLARIHSVEDAKRELRGVAAKWNSGRPAAA